MAELDLTPAFADGLERSGKPVRQHALVIRILTCKYPTLATEGLPFVNIATASPSEGRDRNGPAEGFS
jgi:hypothetical protein